ncbi:ABC transporter substrate-binding protein, partial [Nocardia gipuzkoensis]
MQRVLPALGLVTASAVTLSGCGLGPTGGSAVGSAAPIPKLRPDQQVSIVFESYNYGLAGAWTDTFDTLIAEFTRQHPTTKVTARKPQGNSPDPATDTVASIQTRLVAGHPPDVARSGFGDLDFTIHQLGAKPLDTLVGRDEVRRNFDGAKDRWELRSAAMPAFGTLPTVPTNPGAGLHILSDDPAKQRAAWELIEFLTSEVAYTRIAEGIGYLPLRTRLLDDPDGLRDW